MRVEPIDSRSPHLEAVKALGDANRAKLGFFPEGAFDAYAARAQIAVALDDGGQCVGYVMYRVSASRGEVDVIHLCVERSRRREGTATALIEWLRETTRRDYRGIRLKCRRDYDASGLWPRLGFVAETEVPGRSAARHPLTVWRLDHGHPSLLTASAQTGSGARPPVVLDANVLFDIQDEDRRSGAESLALMADWLTEEVILGATPETLNEIVRHGDAAERRRRRRFLQGFSMFAGPPDAVASIVQRLRPLSAERLKDSDESDLRQLAHAAAAGVPYFVTRDSYMLADDFVNRVYRELSLAVVSPVDLVIRLDELVDVASYQPARLAGSRVQIGRVAAEDVRRLDAFRAGDLGERKAAYRDRLAPLLADPRSAQGLIVQDAAGDPLALTVVTRPTADQLVIPFLRVRPGPLSSTLATHIAMRHVLTAVDERRPIARVLDPHLRDDLCEALLRLGYAQVGDEWVKLQLPVVGAARDVVDALAGLPHHPGPTRLATLVGEMLTSAAAAGDASAMLQVESALWPAKVTDLDIPAYVVPIRPVWARHLLGEEPSQPSLFGTDPILALSWENAYYRAATGSVRCPSRVLWYVSEDRDEPGSRHVRGCSLVREVLVGTPREVFARFRRLGVYEWSDVLAVARGDPNRPMMAFRFSHTELLAYPIPWNDLQEVLAAEEGKRPPIVTVTSISPRCFYRLYRRGSEGG